MKGLVFIKRFILYFLSSAIIIAITILLTALVVNQPSLLFKINGYIIITFRIILQILIGIFIQLPCLIINNNFKLKNINFKWNKFFVPSIVSCFMAFQPLLLVLTNYNIAISKYIYINPYIFSFAGSIWFGVIIIKCIHVGEVSH